MRPEAMRTVAKKRIGAGRKPFVDGPDYVLPLRRYPKILKIN